MTVKPIALGVLSVLRPATSQAATVALLVRPTRAGRRRSRDPHGAIAASGA
jgi:hypothetical protein